MEQENPYRAEQIRALEEIQSIKQRIASLEDSLRSWMDCYLELQIIPIRDESITAKIALHLDRFYHFFVARYEHDQVSTCLRRDVVAWQTYLEEDLAMAPATVNNHLASLSETIRFLVLIMLFLTKSGKTVSRAPGFEWSPSRDVQRGPRVQSLPYLTNFHAWG